MWRIACLLPLAAVLTGCGGCYVSHGGGEDRRTPLERAAQAGDAGEVRRLLSAGADANDRGALWGAPLNAAASKPGNGEVLRVLLAAGANPNGRADEGQACWVPPLMHAAGSGDTENTRVLLEAGARMWTSRCSRLAVGWLKAPVIELLVQHGFNLLEVDESGRNALHLALAPPAAPPFEGIEYLVRAGVPLGARDRAGRTPIDYWREPRDYEVRWFTTWVMERLSSDGFFRTQRENRARIWALLEQAAARR
jgi:ankyrin repeat protein